jgi:NADPH:quinone reductase-like Zn-dependent oxidoreductase
MPSESSMKAVVYEKYGPPQVLQLKDMPMPHPASNEVLVKVYATTVTAGDWRMRKAEPFLVRIFSGLLKPRRVKILGFELAGVVEELGDQVKSFKKGDAVFASCGFRFGAYAEYKCLRDDDNIALKPSNMSFEQAATVPIGALTALRFLRQANVTQGQSVLVYGASGSVGTFAVQIAKHFGATVTGVCSTKNVELVKSLGSDAVVDYTKTDVAEIKNEFDVIFDAVGKMPRSSRRQILKKNGKYVSVTMSPRKGSNDLVTLKELVEADRLKTVIDRTYSLEQIREAHAYVEQFHKRGNVVISVVPAHQQIQSQVR